MPCPVTFGDLLLLARYVHRFDKTKRAKRCKAVLKQVFDAQNHVAITGQVHPYYGDGSISSLCLRLAMKPITIDLKQDDFHALQTVLKQVLKCAIR